MPTPRCSISRAPLHGALLLTALLFVAGCAEFADPVVAPPQPPRAAPARQASRPAPSPAPRAAFPTNPNAKPPTRRRPAPVVAAQMNALWVTRWDFRTAADVQQIMANARAMGFNTIFFQVRGAGTVYFRSAFEPWAYELTSRDPGDTGRDPGWDPLATAVDAGHRNGLSVHAYINVMPGWEDAKAPPPAARTLWTRRPEWFMVDRQGRRMDPASWYAFLNPAIPDVRHHLAGLVGDMLDRYNVDGVHLDYIRWPGEKGDYSHDAPTRAAFQAAKAQLPGTEDERWDRWRSDQIRLLLREIYSTAKGRRPGCLVTAAVIANPDTARDADGQWSWQWRPGLECDVIFPMNYATGLTFQKHDDFFARNAPSGMLGMGLRATHDPQALRAQIAHARSLGIRHLALFAYSDFIAGNRINAKGQLISSLLSSR